MFCCSLATPDDIKSVTLLQKATCTKKRPNQMRLYRAYLIGP
ncbi:hypothetical protein HMPREF0541_01874 [Lacticaseibacillus rhamnosus ATCC 21052]|nr:hypothetical protein HMPREF0541_01874 [Lacticaseibacillus rhamnosus ATCC 21052]